MYRTLRAPITCQIELTSACDNRCVHCYNHWRHGDELTNIHMSEEMLLAAISEIVKNDVFQVTLTGGETLLRKKILFAGVEALSRNQICCAVNSNLTTLTRDDANRMRELGLGGILTSVCSDEASRHDEITRRPGSFVKTLRGIQFAMSAGLTIAASMVVTTLNVGDVVRTGLLLKGMGVKQFFATKASPPLNARSFGEYMISKEDLNRVMESLVELRDSHGMDVGILECYPLCGYKNQARFSFAAGRRCSAGITTCTISAGGDIRPCSHSDETYGNIVPDGLANAWRSMSAWRDGSRVPQECRCCKLLSRCSGGCRVDAKYCSGRYDAMDPYASKDEIADVILSEDLAPALEPVQRMIVNPNLKSRVEEFGVLIADIERSGTPALVTPATHRLVHEFEGLCFTSEDVARATGLSAQNSLKLCRNLLRDRTFLFPKETNQERPVEGERPAISQVG